MADFDLAIIGGGLTGTGIARDAAGRGLRVVLLEQGDLGSGASSASIGLMAGDLEQFERRALLRVRAALAERNVLARIAPHLVRPAKLVLPAHPEDAMITLAIIGLAHNLKLKVVAEGVETQEQLELLAANGCDEIQGYRFSVPTTPEECARMMRENRRLN